jgi:hypothetical protein
MARHLAEFNPIVIYHVIKPHGVLESDVVPAFFVYQLLGNASPILEIRDGYLTFINSTMSN